MSALVPSREYVLPMRRPLLVKPTVIDDRAWVAHIVKHPLGAWATYQRKPWNSEGFDQLSPPTIQHEERERFLRFVRDTESRGAACGVREFAPVPSRSRHGELACYERCPASLVRTCAEAVRVIGERYRALVDESLAALVDGVEVPRALLSAIITQGLLRQRSLAGLVLLATGIMHRSRYCETVAQLNRFDGLRVSFFLHEATLRWRTTFRVVPVSPTAAVRLLLDVPRDESVSATFLVARSWWKQQQVSLR